MVIVIDFGRAIKCDRSGPDDNQRKSNPKDNSRISRQKRAKILPHKTITINNEKGSSLLLQPVRPELWHNFKIFLNTQHNTKQKPENIYQKQHKREIVLPLPASH